MRWMRVLVALMLVVSLSLCLGPICRVQDNNTTPDGDGTDGDGTNGGDTGPQAGGQGIPEGRYAGTLNCADTISTVSDGQETLVSTTPRSESIVWEFNSDGLLLGEGDQPIAAGDEVTFEVSGASGTNTIQSVSKATHQLTILGDASATVNVPGKGNDAVIGPVTEVCTFSEPGTVTVSIDAVFTGNPVGGEFTKVVLECSASLADESP